MDLKTEVNQKENSVCELIVTIPAKEIENKYKQILEQRREQVEIKGFRKGKAPLNRVEEKIGKERLYQLLIQQLISQVYPQAVKEADISPVIAPKVKLVSAEEKKDWKIKFITSEMPEINLNNLREKIKDAKLKEEIWIPGKETEQKASKEEEQIKKQKQFQKTLEIIQNTVEINLADFIIDQEVKRRLTNLVDQIEKAQMDLEEYLASKGTSIQEVKKNYQKDILNGWKVDLALEKIADQEEIEVKEEEVKKLDQQQVDPHIGAKILRRQKALEYLISL